MARVISSTARIQKVQAAASRRSTSQRTAALKSGTISRTRLGAASTQAQRDLDNTIAKLNATNNINTQIYILNTAPASIRTYANQLKSQIISQQKETLSKLNTDLAEADAQSKKRKIRYKKNPTATNKQNYEKWWTIKYELQNVINQMNAGKSYSYDSAKNYAYAVGRSTGRSAYQEIEYKKQQKLAQAKTVKSISEAGLVSVIDKNNNLIGYKTKGSNSVEYRFDKSGNPVFYKSDRFTPVYQKNKIVGYRDVVSKMSVPANLLDKHISNINKDYTNFQKALTKVKLPSGYSFVKNADGDIINIEDKSRGVNIPLSDIPKITGSYLFVPELKKYFSTTVSDWVKNIKLDANAVQSLKWYEKFNPTKVVNYTYRKRYNFYKNNFNGTLSYDDFVKVQWNAADKNFQQTTEGKKIVKALNSSLKDQIQNPDKYGTEARISALISSASGVGLPTAAVILFGSTYFGTLGLAKDVSTNKLPKDFKNTAKIVAKNFGLGTVQGLLYGLAFKGTGALGKKVLGFKFLKGGISKATQVAIRRGLNILGVNYVSKMAGRTTLNIKNIAIGDQELGISGISKDLGTFVGFAIPAVAKRIVSSKKIKLQKKIEELEKFRKGSLNADYLKVKNAQMNDPTRGKYVSIGKGKQLNKNAMNTVSKYAKKNGITKAELLEGSYYKQEISVKSNSPKYEALLKVAKARAKGKTIKVKSVPNYKTFKREGIMVVKTNKDGISKAIAIEFNRVGSKVSYVGIKTGAAVNKFAVTKVYKVARSVKGKPVRLKRQDVFVSKGKLISKKQINENVISRLDRIKTNKVFLDGKRLNNKELIELRKAIKTDLKTPSANRVEAYIKSLYKSGRFSGRSQTTNVLRVQRVGTEYKISLLNKKTPQIKVNQKGNYFEIGYSKFKIPSQKRIVTIKKVPKKVSTTKTKNGIPTSTIKKMDNTIKNIKIPSTNKQNLQIVSKSGITKTQEKMLENAIKSTQTIIKPITRRTTLSKPLQKGIVKTIIRNLSIVRGFSSTKNISTVRNIQSVLNKTLLLSQSKVINTLQLKRIARTQLSTLKTLQNITLSKTISPTISRVKAKTSKPSKKISGVTLKKIKPTKKSRIKKPITSLGYRTVKLYNRKLSPLNTLPLSKARALDLLAYSLSKSRSIKGQIVKSSKRTSLSTLKRKVSNAPTGYFNRNRNKFILRKIKGRVDAYEMIKKNK